MKALKQQNAENYWLESKCFYSVRDISGFFTAVGEKADVHVHSSLPESQEFYKKLKFHE